MMKNSVKALIALLLSACLMTLYACGTVEGGVKRTLSSITVTRLPDKVNYFEGETFDKTGMVVTAEYSGAESKNITTYSVDKTTLSADDEYVTVTYRDMSVKVYITVAKIAVAALTITKQPDKTQYIEGETFDASGMTVTARYTDGTEKVIGDYTVDVTTPLNEDDESLPVTYLGETAYVKVSVKKAARVDVSLVNMPIKKVYVNGETFDKTGLLLEVETEDETYYTSNVGYSDEPLAFGVGAVTITYLGQSLSVPVAVIEGQAMTFTSGYTDESYDAMINTVKNAVSVTTAANDFRLGFDAATQLTEPYPDGVTSVEQFIKEADYHIFYNVESFVIKTDFDYGDVEKLLDRLYVESDLLASSASVKGKAISGGYVQVVVKYYNKDLMITSSNAVIPVITEGEKIPRKRTKTHVFEAIDGLSGVSVYSSDQALYALTHGYKIAPVKDSPAEKLVEKAKSVLISVINDDMTPFEKMYNIYVWLLQNAAYDNAVSDAVSGNCLDKEYESDMLCSLFTSFYAEGPLFYGATVCYGYAKAYGLLLAMEGLDVTRVVAQTADSRGRSAFNYDADSGQYVAFRIHSYNYVKIDGLDYLSDVTYACAGKVKLDGKEVVMYRNFCIAMTKKEHKYIYSGFPNDKVSSGDGYAPASHDMRLEHTYDGEHSYLCQTTDEINAYVDYVLSEAKADASSTYFYVPIYASDGCLDSSQEVSDCISALLNGHKVPRWYRYISTCTVGGNGYWLARVCLRIR